MSSTQTSTTSSQQQQYYLTTDYQQQPYYSSSSSSPSYNTSYRSEKEIDVNAQSWKLPYEVDDSDLMFDGKPLNMLYEENRMSAEKRSEKKPSRGRSRQSKK